MSAATRISFQEAAERLARGEIGIVPTDTIYGFVASAMLPEAVERLYRARGRNEQKPCIVLIAECADIDRFGVTLSKEARVALQKMWPGKVSVIFPGISDEFLYLHRGMGTLAFRVPDSSALRDMLALSGPIIAPSANPEGMKPAETLEEAGEFFGTRADFFVDGRTLSGLPSTLVRYENDRLAVIRQGAVQIPFSDM